MKRSMLLFLVGLSIAIGINAAPLNAQHGHSGGTNGLGPAGAGPDAPGRGGLNAGGNGSGSDHSASSVMASRNPGSVLDHNAELSSKLEGLLGLSGPNALSALKTDASGFKNFGQFVAAVHVSHNLSIPFSELQAKMTGSNAVSLGKAIQELKPDADAKNEAQKAGIQADSDVKGSTS